MSFDALYMNRLYQLFSLPLPARSWRAMGTLSSFSSPDKSEQAGGGVHLRRSEMRVVIDIPKDFARDYCADKFKDFFSRVIADIDCKGM